MHFNEQIKVGKSLKIVSTYIKIDKDYNNINGTGISYLIQSHWPHLKFLNLSNFLVK